MRFVNPILRVSDVVRSRVFYEELLGLVVERDDGNFVRFKGGFAIHDGAALHLTVWGTAASEEVRLGTKSILLYFEHDDLDGIAKRLRHKACMIHPIERQPWGQMVFRFFDPDGHAIEIGEPGY